MADTIELPGEELNRRLEELSLKIERVSILLEDVMVDPSDSIGLDRAAHNNLQICLARYEEFLNHLQATTVDTMEEIRDLVGASEDCYGAPEEDRDEAEEEQADEDLAESPQHRH